MVPIHLTSACTLLVIDTQERLIKVMPQARQAQMTKHVPTLIELAAHVGADIVYTEQYPKGLGPTVESIKQTLEGADALRVEKNHFDACAAPSFEEALGAMKRRVIVCGIEAHVCVLSTVRSLRTLEHDVLVPFDAVASRDEEYRANGLELMRESGALMTNTETLVFSTLGHSKHPEFKRFSKMVQ